MENKTKKLILAAVSEILIAVSLIIFFKLPFTKAVSWKMQDGYARAVNTRYSTNYSKEINNELDKIYNMPLGEAIKAQVAEEAKEKKQPKKTERPVYEYKILSNTSNSSILEVKRTCIETDRTKLREDGSFVSKVYEKDCYHLNIYIDKNGLKTTIEKIY